jgi:glycerol kinase
MQFQADLLDLPVERPRMIETTALGAVLLAGLGAGVWPDVEGLPISTSPPTRFEPRMDDSERDSLLSGWRDAVRRTRSG